MTYDTAFHPTLADHQAIEDEANTDEDRRAANRRADDALRAQLIDAGIARVESQLEGANWRRVVMLTGEKLGAMEPHEIRALVLWMENRADLIARQLRLAKRHLAAEPVLPEYLRARAAV